MKHFVLTVLLAVLLGATGCVGYRPATSPYYTSYYNAYDVTSNCYYHPSNFCCRRNYGFARGGGGNGYHHSGGSGGGHHGGGGHSHSSSGHSSGGHGH